MTVRELIEKCGGEILYRVLGAQCRWVMGSGIPVSQFQRGGMWCDDDEPVDDDFDALLAAHEALLRAEYEEVECPNVDYKYDEEHPADCSFCKGTGKLFRKVGNGGSEK